MNWLNNNRQEKLQPQKCTFWKKVSKKLIVFYNFALKIETSGAKKVVKSIMKTWNYVIVHVWFIHSLIKFLRTCNVKQNNLNAQNLQ